jgi:hydrogenase maturation protease
LNKRIKIAGVGSVITGDDGVGPYTVRVLDAGYSFQDGIEVEDLGTPGLDLIAHMADVDIMIIVDAVENGLRPGAVTLYRRDDILKARPESVRIDPHSPVLSESLLIADFAGNGLDCLLIGITAESLRSCTKLSPSVQAAIPRAIEEILRELDRLGVGYEKKAQPSKPDIWWEALSM